MNSTTAVSVTMVVTQRSQRCIVCLLWLQYSVPAKWQLYCSLIKICLWLCKWIDKGTHMAYALPLPSYCLTSKRTRAWLHLSPEENSKQTQMFNNCSSAQLYPTACAPSLSCDYLVRTYIDISLVCQEHVKLGVDKYLFKISRIMLQNTRTTQIKITICANFNGCSSSC